MPGLIGEFKGWRNEADQPAPALPQASLAPGARRLLYTQDQIFEKDHDLPRSANTAPPGEPAGLPVHFCVPSIDEIATEAHRRPAG